MGRNASAIMRREGRVRAALAVAPVWIAMACWGPASEAEDLDAPTMATATAAATADSVGAWLPPPIEDVDEPDLLEADPVRSGASIRLERGEEHLRVRRVEWAARSAIRRAGVAVVARDARPPWITAVSAPRGGGDRKSVV